MKVLNLQDQMEKVRLALGPKGPLAQSEVAERNKLRAKFLRTEDRDSDVELEAFVDAVAAAQDSLSELARRGRQLASQAEAAALLLEAAATIDMLETDLLEFRFATPDMAREFSDGVRASMLSSVEPWFTRASAGSEQASQNDSPTTRSTQCRD